MAVVISPTSHVPKPERQQIGRQQDGDVAVGEGPQRAADQQQARFGRDAGGEQHYFSPSKRADLFNGVSAHHAYSASYITMPCFSISWSSVEI